MSFCMLLVDEVSNIEADKCSAEPVCPKILTQIGIWVKAGQGPTLFKQVTDTLGMVNLPDDEDWQK